MIKLVVISDTHTLQSRMKYDLPEGDLLFHGGDMMSSGWNTFELEGYVNWLKDHSHKYQKIIQIAGNHDRLVENNNKWAREILSQIPNLVYLENEEYIYKDIKIYGSPITPEFCGWAFMKERGFSIKRYWDNIPNDTEILVTHGPPYGILDWVLPNHEKVGCEQLAKKVSRLHHLKLQIFGHVHEAYGIEEKDGVLYINASTCNVDYNPVNKPIEIIYEKGQMPIVLP